MELLTLKGGWGRNRRFEIKDGRVQIHRNGHEPETELSIKDGQIIEVEDTEYRPHNNSTRTVTTKTWNGCKGNRSDAVKTTQNYDTYFKLPSDGVFYEVKGLRIGKHKGVLHQISRKARFIREEFIYDSGQTAYVWTPYRKRFQVFRPDGKLWMEVTAKVRRHYRRTNNLLEKVQAALGDIASDGDRWSGQPSYEIRLLDRRQRAYGYGKIENNQRVGLWQQGKIRHYYMMGVSVGKEIYYAGPDELDPRKVLKTENMQLRAALMKKIGPERLLKKLPFVACDIDGENQLLKADVDKIFKLGSKSTEQMNERNRLNNQIAIAVLKCPSTGQFYYLRVPPMLKKVEHARQWLCGIDIENVEERYIRDRYITESDGGRLSTSEKEEMRDEIAEAKQREKLEFVSEA
jgi:hypothetical protein